MINKLLSLSRIYKKLILIITDSFLLVVTLLTAFSLRLEHWYWPNEDLFLIIFCAPLIAIPIFIRFSLYRAIIRYIGFKALWRVVQAVTLYAILWGIVGFMVTSQGTGNIQGIPRSVILINWILAVLVIVGLRMVARWILTNDRDGRAINVVIYGAGAAGRQLSNALMQSNEYNTVAFIDDNIEMHKQSINGIEVISPIDFEQLISKNTVTEVLLAVPKTSRARRKEIINFLEPFPVLVRSLPSVSELAQGKVKIADLREVTIKDLLGRDTVVADQELLSLNIFNKVQ